MEKWQARGTMNGTTMLIVKAGLKDDAPDWDLTTAMNERGPNYICKVETPATGAEAIMKGRTPEHRRAYLIAAAPELLEAVRQQHNVIDMLMATLIGKDDNFLPSQQSFWPQIVAANELLKKFPKEE